MTDPISLMTVNSPQLGMILSANQTNSTANINAAADASTFDSIFQSAIGLVGSTNDYLQQASQAEVAFATGEMTNTHELAVIEQKANLSLQYTVAIKNQLLSAYKEIMQMQI